jgi:hypothetical protein
MKLSKLVIALGCLLLTSNTWGQGLVTFQNANSISGWKPVADRHVKWGDNNFGYAMGVNVSSSHVATVRAQLFYGVPGSQPDQLTEVQFAPATFKGGSSSTLGSWFGGTRTLPGFTSGNSVALQVRVWDYALSTNAGLARAALGTIAYGDTNGGHYGESEVFSYTVPSEGSSSSEYLMNNLTSVKFEYFPLNTNPAAPIWIIRQPHPPVRTIKPGENALFTVRAYGNDLEYQWLHNGTNFLSGENGPALLIANAIHSQAGQYNVLISNSVGVVTSSVARLNIQPSLDAFLLPTVRLDGQAGMTYRLEYINAISGNDTWISLTNITLTASTNYFFDFEGVGKRERYYRLVLP